MGLFIWGFVSEAEIIGNPPQILFGSVGGSICHWKTISHPIVKISDPLWELFGVLKNIIGKL